MTVTLDTVAPVVNITAPTDGLQTKNTSVNVTYTTSEGTCSRVNNTSYTLTAGPNTITVTCTDAAGNTGSDSVTVTRDNGAPLVDITIPANNTITNQSSIAVTYTVTDNFDASPSCNIASGASVNLSNGSNTITVTCTDDAGNSGSDSVTVVRDSANPVVDITSPVAGVTKTAGQTLTFGVTDATATTCDKSSGSSITLSEGSNTITVTCTDAAGNVGTDSVTVTLDTVAPVVNITAPTDGLETNASSVNVTFTTSEGTCNRTNNTSAALVAGSNTITVTCTDAAGNSGSDSVTVIRDNTNPVVNITSPANNTTTNAGSIAVNFTATDNVDSSPSCNIASGDSVSLSAGSNTITVTCTDNAGNSGSDSVTVVRDSVAPVVNITSPADGSSVAPGSYPLNYTATDNLTPSGSLVCTPANGSNVTVATGSNTFTVNCTDQAGNTGTDSVTVTGVLANPPNTSITQHANPSAGTPATGPASPALNVAFNGTESPTGFECRVIDSGDVEVVAWASCTSPWTVPTSGLASPAQYKYEVRAVNGAGADTSPAFGYFWNDNRTFTAVPSNVQALPNSIEPTAAAANDAGAHPNIGATLTLEGYDDPQSATVFSPDGLMGSLAAVPVANRCTIAQANASNCPASSLIGTATAIATSATDGEVTANGNIYLVDPTGLPTTDAAGVAAEFDDIVSPLGNHLGDVVATGGLRINDQGQNLKIIINDIPRQTSTGNRFHLRTGNLVINGDTRPNMGAPASATNPPLLYNPHVCTRTVPLPPGYSDARPNWNKFAGSGTGYNGSVTPTITAPYSVDNCIPGVLFNPTLNYDVTNKNATTDPNNPEAGPINVTMGVPFDHSPISKLESTLSPWLSANTAAFGAGSDMCSPGIVKYTNSLGTQLPNYQYWDFWDASLPCPASAVIGTADITTPLLDGVTHADVLLMDKAPIPWLGLRVSADYPGNPQGVNIGISIQTATVNYPDVNNYCVDFGICDQAIQATTAGLPDLPLSSVVLHLGNIPNRVGSGSGTVLSSFPVKNAQAIDAVCRAGDPIQTKLFAYRGGTKSYSQPNDPIGCTS